MRTQASFLATCAAIIAVGGFGYVQIDGTESDALQFPADESTEPTVTPASTTTVPGPRPEPVETTEPELSGLAYEIDEVPPAVSVQTLIVTGTASEGTRVFSQIESASHSPDGRWSVPVALFPGANEVMIQALGSNGEIATETFSVRFEPGELADVEFTAQQEIRSTQALEPWDRFAGTATPLSLVVVRSDYGTRGVYADETGAWDVVVFFDAPGGTFPVVVEAVNGSATFDFTFAPVG